MANPFWLLLRLLVAPRGSFLTRVGPVGKARVRIRRALPLHVADSLRRPAVRAPRHVGVSAALCFVGRFPANWNAGAEQRLHAQRDVRVVARLRGCAASAGHLAIARDEPRRERRRMKEHAWKTTLRTTGSTSVRFAERASSTVNAGGALLRYVKGIVGRPRVRSLGLWARPFLVWNTRRQRGGRHAALGAIIRRRPERACLLQPRASRSQKRSPCQAGCGSRCPHRAF